METLPLSQAKTTLLRSLLERKGRERHDLLLVEGERTLGEAAGAGLLRFLVARDAETAPRWATLAEGWNVPLLVAGKAVWGEVSEVVSSPGLLGVAERPSPLALPALGGEGRSLVLFLDAVQDPGNAGAMIRSAWALGAAGALLGKGTVNPGNPKAVRASAGGVFRLPLLEGAGEEELRSLLGRGYALVLAGQGGDPCPSFPWPSRCVLAVGNEGAGLSPLLRSLPGREVTIPMPGGAESLNVLAAASILMASWSWAPPS